MLHCDCSKSGWPQTCKTWNTQGFLWTWKTQGILKEFCAALGKNCNKQSILVHHSNICVKQLLTCYVAGVDVEWPLMKVIITFTFCCDNLWKSKFMTLEKPGKLGGIFFSYFVNVLLLICVCVCVCVSQRPMPMWWWLLSPLLSSCLPSSLYLQQLSSSDEEGAVVCSLSCICEMFKWWLLNDIHCVSKKCAIFVF